VADTLGEKPGRVHTVLISLLTELLIEMLTPQTNIAPQTIPDPDTKQTTSAAEPQSVSWLGQATTELVGGAASNLE
jgi:hypothetical protein